MSDTETADDVLVYGDDPVKGDLILDWRFTAQEREDIQIALTFGEAKPTRYTKDIIMVHNTVYPDTDWSKQLYFSGEIVKFKDALPNLIEVQLKYEQRIIRLYTESRGIINKAKGIMERFKMIRRQVTQFHDLLPRRGPIVKFDSMSNELEAALKDAVECDAMKNLTVALEAEQDKMHKSLRQRLETIYIRTMATQTPE